MSFKHLAQTCLLFVCIVLPVQAEKIFLTSLDWPPYSGAQLDKQGASIAVARAAFEAMGHELIVDFYPWARTVALAKSKESKYMGYFPEYYADDIALEFIFSDVMGTGPLGFAEHVDKPVKWNALEDLKDSQIGTVQGYVNTAKFDQMAAEKKLNTQPVVNDAQNLLKLAHQRIDLAVIDPNVLNYLMDNEVELKKYRGVLKMNDKLLVDKELFVCFKKNSDGERWVKIFNEGLKKIDVEKIMKENMGQ